MAARRGGGRVGDAHRLRGRGHGAGGAGRLHRPAAGHPGRAAAGTPGSGATYLQTVRALARVTEVGGYVEAGHSAPGRAGWRWRSGGSSACPSRRCSSSSTPRSCTTSASCSLRDPIPGGATVLVLARGAAADRRVRAPSVIEQARVLDRGRRHRAPAVRPVPSGRHGRSRRRVGSRIIRAANAFDDLVGRLGRPRAAAAAAAGAAAAGHRRASTTRGWSRR